jgi:hypothetical protein
MLRNLSILLTLSFLGSSLLSSNSLAQTSSNSKGNWGNLFSTVKSHSISSQGSGSRGSNFCLITPGQLGDKPVVFSGLPVIFWKNPNKPSPIEFRVFSSSDEQGDEQILWRKRIDSGVTNPNIQYIQYQGNPLKNQQSYRWEYLDLEEHTKVVGNFKTVDLQEHKDIAKDLEKIDLEMKGKSKEEIILEKAQYFTNKNLWNDALQELYSINNPTKDFVAQRDKLFDSFCSSPAQ